MSTKVDVWMPIYIGDYLASTSRLTTEQHGAYLLLIMDYWKNGPPPDDDAVLAQICRMSPDAWSNARSTIRAFFEQDGSTLKHKRIDSELADAKDGKLKRIAKASAAAAKRWGKNAPSNTPSNQQAMPEQCPSPSPSPSKSSSSLRSEEGSAKKSSAFCAQSYLISVGVDPGIAADWLTLRKSKKAAVTKTAIDGVERESSKAGLSLGDALAICCQRGWAGFNSTWDWGQLSSAKNSPAKSQYQINHEATTRAVFGSMLDRPGDLKTIEGEVV